VGYQCIHNANRLHEDIMQRRCSYLLDQLCKKKWNEIRMKELAGGYVWKTIVFWGPWSSRCSLVAYDFRELYKKSELKIVNYGYVRGYPK
jgi:hypothetical protein